MKPKRKSVIQHVLVLLAVLAMLCCGPVVAGSLKGSAEKLIDQRLQPDSRFTTAGSTRSTLAAGQRNSANGDTFSSASVWSLVNREAEIDASNAWQACYGLNCVLAYMKKSGASEESMNFTRKIGREVFEVAGYLETFEEKGRVDLGFVELPGRANTNGAYVLLNGSPSLVSTELGCNVLAWHQPCQRTALDISRDPNYSRLKMQYPELEVWPAGARFSSVDAGMDGGQRFIFPTSS